jgi:DNA-binding transcriptional regulator GbsR (MarR family)
VTDHTRRDDDGVRIFIERFASALVDGGMPRMAARVFVAVLAADSGRQTAAELAASLQASPAAISGAIRYLEQVSLASRERDPGTRHDVYRVNNDVWYRVSTSRDRLLSQFIAALTDGIDAVGSETPAGERLQETKSFFAFLLAELPQIVERWHAKRQESAASPAIVEP